MPRQDAEETTVTVYQMNRTLITFGSRHNAAPEIARAQQSSHKNRVKWIATVVASIVYWATIVVLVPVVAMMHGDCGLEHGPALTTCLNEKKIVLAIFIIMALALYV